MVTAGAAFAKIGQAIATLFNARRAITMEQEQLKATLGDLHRELSAHTAVDPEVRTLLRQLSADIDTLLASPSTTGGDAAASSTVPATDRQTTLDNVLSLASEFEESHPQLATALGRVADALSRLGI